MSARILVVDDEDIVIQCCLRILKEGTYQVEYVKSGLEAVKKIAESHFDLIILDFMMPKMDGMEVLKRVREMQPGIKVIMVTGLDQTQTAQRAKDLGAFAYLPKPFDPDDLKLAVERAVSEFQAH
ncbi:MAG: response regulator [Betaproteobacteria bacterium]|nr:response regulator [Betaproteobacteria bacterium]